MTSCMNRIYLGAAGALLMLGLAACGGGGGSDLSIAPKPVPVDLSQVTPGAYSIQPGTYPIEPGDTADAGDVAFSCASGGGGCTVKVTGSGQVTSTGGQVSAANSMAYQASLNKTQTGGAGASGSAGSTSGSQPARSTTSTPSNTPTNVTMALPLTPAMQAAIRTFFPATRQNSQTISIEAGKSVTRAGVTFTCNSTYPCTVTLTNELNAVVATYATQRLGSATARVTASLPSRRGTFGQLNAAHADSAKALIEGGIDNTATDHDSSPKVGNSESASVEGLGLGGEGPTSLGTVELRGPFDPNNGSGAYTDETVAFSSPDGESKTSRIGSNAATGGLALTDAAGASGAPTGWQGRSLFADWGDTHPHLPDGGFETGALVYSNMEAPKKHPFDDKLGDRFVNEFLLPGIASVGGRTPYHFTVDLVDADNDPDTADNDTVSFTVNTSSPTPGGKGSYVNADAASRGALKIAVSSASDASFQKVEGRYLGMTGTYTCSGSGADACQLSRARGSDNFTLGAGDAWQFTPAAGQKVSVPDQDWIVFGAWATTPDDAENGKHRIGVFHDGMNLYRTVANALTGTATYNGGAAGFYVEGNTAGFFTARARIDVDFGAADAAGTVKNTSKIDNFKDSAGRFLGADAPGSPNSGADNDWVVILGEATLAPAMTGTTSGSADGVSWSGNWSASLYGAGDVPTTKTKPTGIAGTFDASTTTGNVFRGVTGSFGAATD